MSADNEQSLAKRFYKDASFVSENAGVRILLDERPLRTPAKAEFLLPNERLAEEVVREWRAQGEKIVPDSMPYTKLCNTAIDGVANSRKDVIDAIMAFAATDLICYRAEAPDALVMKQMALWGPVLDWVLQYLGADFEISEGVMHVEQSPEALARVRAVLEPHDPFSLAAFHVMASLTGSTLLSIAHAAGLFDLQATWTAAHVDEDWQISQWGRDEEAAARRTRRWAEMEVASRTFAIVNEKPA